MPRSLSWDLTIAPEKRQTESGRTPVAASAIVPSQAGFLSPPFQGYGLRHARFLGIETTCDETAAAVVRLRARRLGGNFSPTEVMSQIAATRARSGASLPEIAGARPLSRSSTFAHGPPRSTRGPKVAAKGPSDGVAAAAGPGLIGGRARRPDGG